MARSIRRIAKAALAKYAPECKGADAEDRGKCENYNFKEELRSRDDDAHADVLAVMLPGRPYAELSEVRRRTRYAVLSGLETRGYIEKTQDHIGCWTPDDPLIPREIPFEWVQDNNEKHHRLVLWLNEDIFDTIPLRRISRVLERLKPKITPSESSDLTRPTCSIAWLRKRKTIAWIMHCPA